MNEFESDIQKYLNKLLNEFKKCKSKKKYIELLNIYHIIEDIINNVDMNVNYSKEFEYELKKYNIDRYDKLYELKFIDNYDVMYNYNLVFSNIYRNIPNERINNMEYQETIDLNDTVEMVQEFFKYFSEDMYNYFNKQILDNGLLVISDKIEGGRTYLSNHLLPPYSLINPTLCAKDYVVIIHETVHSYIRNRLRYITFEQLNTMLVNNLEEVYPIFTELCAIKFAQEKNMLNELDKYKKAVYSSLYKYLEKYNTNIIDSNIKDYVKNERYSYGYLLAYRYFDIYNNNQEEAKQKILKLSLESPYHDKKFLLNNYGNNQFDLLNTTKLINSIKLSV